MVEKEKVILSDICEQIGQAYIELVEVRVDTLLAFYLWTHVFVLLSSELCKPE